MGQFKPMVKMETTEPSVELKLKKGGHVNMKKGGKAEAGHKKMAMGGGAMDMMMGTPALVGRPAVNAPVRTPGKPSMASRRKAMMAKPAMPDPSMAPPPMKKGGKAEGGKSDMAQDKAMIKKAFKQHDMQEHKGDKGTSLKLKKGGIKQGGMATGGVTNGQGGYKTGGVALGNGGGYRDGGMPMKDGVPAFVGDGKGKMKKGGKMGGGMMGYATGGVTLGNAGGFKHGGKSSKKAYATGGTVNSGKPVAMPQGAKKPSQPISTNRFTGTFKKGGTVTPAEGNLMKAFGMENAPAMKSAKAQSKDVYSKYQKMADGGSPTSDERFFDKNKVDPKSVSDKTSRELEEALNPLSMVKELYGKARDAFRGQGSMSDKEKSMPLPTKGAVTKTEKSITVTPAGKRRGGRAC